jgi:hypothetical protein
MINEIKKSILNKCPFQLQDAEKKELDQFLENYIAPLSITDFVVRESDSEMEVKTLIRTADKIGIIGCFRDPEDENQFQCIFTTYPINQLANISIFSIKENGNIWNSLLIETVKNGDISFVYALDDHDIIRFVQRLLTI